MVSLLIVSHSEKLAQGVKEMAKVMAPDVTIGAVGGKSDGSLGNEFYNIHKELEEVYSEEGVVVLFDLGSSYMMTEMVKETLEVHKRDNIHLVDASLVEGALIAAVEMSLGSSIDIVKGRLMGMKMNKI